MKQQQHKPVVRTCWAFLRTLQRDYRNGVDPHTGKYPWRKAEEHMACLLMRSDLVLLVALFETRREAVAYAREKGERGRPVRVRVTLEIPS